jgi:Tol biopolymer transport system component
MAIATSTSVPLAVAQDTYSTARYASAWSIDLHDGAIEGLALGVAGMGGASDFRVSPGRTHLAFTADDERGRRQVHVGTLHGADVMALSHEPAGADSPAWSADGRRVVFRAGERVLVVVESSSARESFRLRSGGQVWTPSFTPDGRRIMFTRARGTRLELWTVRLDGGDPELVRRDAANGVPSPDGRSIAYHPVEQAAVPGRWALGGSIWLMDAHGRHSRALFEAHGGWGDTDVSEERPAWSPDGSRLVYSNGGAVIVVDARSGNGVTLGLGRLPSWHDDHTIVVEHFVALSPD